MDFVPHTAADREAMLRTIGVDSVEALLAEVPRSVRCRELTLPLGLPEPELWRQLQRLAAKNGAGEALVSFLGAGAYDHFIPAAVEAICSRGEFATAYTPYQAEASQGGLQAMFEYQSLMCELTGLDVSNASLYDGASALAEAALVAVKATGRREVLLAGGVHPAYQQVVRTYLSGLGVGVESLPATDGVVAPAVLQQRVSDQTAAVLVQHPNFFGCLEAVETLSPLIHAVGALYVVSVHPLSLGVLEAPGAYGADIAVGEGQPLGIPLSGGGPYLGVFTCRADLVRKMPGRVVGETTDPQGRRGYVLTLQAREQHIRRARAGSNICTNQALCALRACVYLSLLGWRGLQEVAALNVRRSHEVCERLLELPGVARRFAAPFFNEFVVRLPEPAAAVCDRLGPRGLVPGLPLARVGVGGERDLLICVTEMRTDEEIDRLVEGLGARQ